MNWYIAPDKILRYLLSATNPKSASKNRFFRTMGFDPEKWEIIRDALAQHPTTAELGPIDTSSSYGEKRVFRCNIVTPNGRNPCILTVWMRSAGRFEFIAAYPQSL